MFARQFQGKSPHLLFLFTEWASQWDHAYVCVCACMNVSVHVCIGMYTCTRVQKTALAAISQEPALLYLFIFEIGPLNGQNKVNQVQLAA